ncbi:MAG: hypothetical protein Q4C70_12305 [Planctomycetia bacterium]|nr:hypothetical protein [Planctomycetia bacterium]
MKKYLPILFTLLLALPITSVPTTQVQGASIHFSFETSLDGWKVVEGSFGDTRCGLEFQHHSNNTKPWPKDGKFHFSSLENKDFPDDTLRGVGESPIWKNTGKTITLRVGGGTGNGTPTANVDKFGETTVVQLCEICSNECAETAPQVRVVAEAHGKNSQVFVPTTWDTEALIGKNLMIRMVDNATGGWGHVTLDDVKIEGELKPELTEQFRKVRGRVLPDLPKFIEIKPTVVDPDAKKNAELVRAPILYVAREQYRRDHHNTATLFQTGEINTNSFVGGSALRIADFSQLDANGNPKITTILECQDGIIRDPDVSFDGKRILISMRKNKEDDYHIYELNADGSGLRQITYGSGVSDIDPIYLPNGKILFGSTREPKFCMCNRHIMCNLFTMNADGSELDQIGHSTLFEGHPSLLADGRVVYYRWEYVDRNFGDAQGLWVTNPDGTSHLIYWGNNIASPGAVIDPHEIPGTSKVVCTFSSCHDRPWGGIAILDRSQGIDSPNAVEFTLPPEGRLKVGVGGYDNYVSLPVKYEDPRPLSDSVFLCSRQNKESGVKDHMELVLFDLDGHETSILTDENPKWGIYDAQRLASRPLPKRIESRLDPPSTRTQTTGTFYVSDVYESQEMKNVERGEVKYLRVIESPEKRYWTREGWSLAGEQAPAMNWHDFSNKRLLGTVPVEEDGSANFEIPADTFVFFQLLNEKGEMIHSMRSGTIVRPGENQGCIGCHEDRLNAVPPRRTVKALLRPASALKLPEWHPAGREFSYMEHVQPIFDRHCVQCHDFNGPGAKSVILAPDRNLLFNVSYTSIYQNNKIIAPGAGPTKTMDSKSWGSTVSRLSQIVSNGHGDARDEKFKLTDTEKDIVRTWIDLNGPYYPTFACNYRQNRYGRSPLTNDELNRLTQLTGVKFEYNSRNFWQVIFDRPEFSECLKKLDANSAEYREAITIIKTGADRLKTQTRADMKNFQMRDEDDLRRMEKYDRCQVMLEEQRKK